MTNYQAMARRIEKAKTIIDLNKLDSSMNRLWDAGFLTPNEFMRLDLKIVDKKIKYELEPQT